jgi:hypothetical protein
MSDDLLGILSGGQQTSAPAPTDLRAVAAKAAQDAGVPSDFYVRLIDKGENGFANPAAVSPKGARGPAQLMPDTAKAMGVENIDDPTQNLAGGAKYLKGLLDKYKGNQRLAAAAYNAGPDAVDQAGGVPTFPETQSYVSRVLGAPPTDLGAVLGGQSDDSAAEAAFKAAFGAAQPGQPGAPSGSVVPNEVPVRYDDVLGFQKGVMTPIDNLAHWANKLINLDSVAHALGMPTTDEAIQSHKNALITAEQQGVQPGLIGQTVGGMVAGAPLVAAGAGPLTAGAALGALGTEHPDNPIDVAKDAAIGAVGGKLGDIGISAAKGVISPVLKPAINKLVQSGVSLTPGQLMGGIAKTVEDKLTSLPLAGDMINAARARGIASFNRAAVNSALEPVGEALSPGLVGRDAIAEAQQKLSGAYAKALTGSTLHVDQGLIDDLVNEVRPRMLDLTPDRQEQLRSILMNRLGARVQNNAISDVDLNRVDSELGNLARNYSSSGDGDQRGLGDAISATQDALRDMIERQNPATAAKLSAARKGYAMLTRVERAAASAGNDNGVFTPQQLSAAVRAGDSSVRKRSYAAGNALMQDLSDAGREVLPNKVPNSGTTDRFLTNLLFAGAGLEGANLGHVAPQFLAGSALAAAPYTQVGNRLVQSAMTERPAFAPMIAQQLEKLRLPATVAGAAAATNAFAQDGNANQGDGVLAVLADGTRVTNRKDAKGNYITLPPTP